MASGYPVSVSIDGETFLNLRKLATHLDVNRKTIEGWIKVKLPDETVDQCVRRNVERKRVRVDGKVFKNRADLGRANGIVPSEAARIVRHGNDVSFVVRQRAVKLIKRQAADRPPQIDWSSRPLHEIVADWPHLQGALANLDLSNAHRLPGRGSQPARIEGVACKVHGPLPASFLVKDLTSGQQPCRTCRANRVAAPRSRTEQTLERLASVAKERGDFSIIGASLERVVRTGDRTRIDIRVSGATCTTCEVVLGPLWYHRLAAGIFKCACPRMGRYSEEDVRKKVFQAHGPLVQLREFSGLIQKRQSRFLCTLCEKEWSATVNAVIGSTANHPTGCPTCSRPGARASVIGTVLDDLGIAYEQEAPLRVPGQSEMRSDYILRLHDIAIEYDGDHHYRPSGRHSDPTVAVAEYEAVVLRDTIKRDALLEAGIRTCRIPYWVVDLRAEVELILAGAPTYPDLPDRANFDRCRSGK